MNPTHKVGRTGAGRLAQGQSKHQGRLARVPDFAVRCCVRVLAAIVVCFIPGTGCRAPPSQPSAAHSGPVELKPGMAIGAAQSALLAAGAVPQNMPPGFDMPVWKLADGRTIAFDVRSPQSEYDPKAPIVTVYLWQSGGFEPMSRLSVSGSPSPPSQ
jgi:hypothetical protein